MCYHVENPTEEEIYENANSANFGLEYRWEMDYQPIYDYPGYFHNNGFAHNHIPIICNDNPHTVTYGRWGYLPSKVKTEDDVKEQYKKVNGLNIRLDDAFDNFFYKAAVAERRGIALIKGGYDFHTMDVEGKKDPVKFPFYFFLEGSIFMPVGITWNEVKLDNGNTIRTAGMLTGPGDPLFNELHNRPKHSEEPRKLVILRPGDFEDWLSGKKMVKDDARKYWEPALHPNLRAHPITQEFNSPRKFQTNRIGINDLVVDPLVAPVWEKIKALYPAA